MRRIPGLCPCCPTDQVMKGGKTTVHICNTTESRIPPVLPHASLQLATSLLRNTLCLQSCSGLRPRFRGLSRVVPT